MRRALAALALTLLAPPVSADVLGDIVDRGEIRFGVREAAAPFSFVDEAGAPAGLAPSLCIRVAEEIAATHAVELEAVFVPVTSTSRFEALASGEIDVHCGPMTASLSRREAINFSIPYFMDGVGAALRRDGVQDVGALAGQPVGALKATTAVKVAREWGAPGGSPIVEFESHDDGLRALGRGEIDAYFGDQGLLLHRLAMLKAEDRLIPIAVGADQFSYEPYSLAMRAGEGRLRLEVDRALSRIYLSQEIFDHVADALGDFEMSEFATFLYVLVALPE